MSENDGFYVVYGPRHGHHTVDTMHDVCVNNYIKAIIEKCVCEFSTLY